jgi:neutral ceramidase
LTEHVWSFDPGVIIDTHPSGAKFGSVHIDVDTTKTYKAGDQVVCEFWTGHPKNNLMTEKTFLTVEKRTGSGPDDFVVVLTDNDWDTKFKWTRHGIAESLATIWWNLGETSNVEAGTYRIRHFGVSKDLFGTKTPFVGVSSEFKVI